MQSKSPPLTVIGTNGKPTIIDFWAPWCENCKVMAPTLYSLEEEYHDKVNFITIDGDNPASYDLVSAFHVDAIPHIAIVTPEGDVETALIGPIPRTVLKGDIETLLQNQKEPPSKQMELPYKMYDAFENEPSRRIRFVSKE
jgi:thioredoxin-like negative regulator of GroEL